MQSLHPINLYLRRAIKAFKKNGFIVLDSPEIVSEKNNFDDLLIPHDHPARDMQDTFWFNNGMLPRTHTSAFQIPAMKNKKPPVRFLIPGRVFRNEATDATHEVTFYQLEGFVIDKSVNLANLKATLQNFLKIMYGSDIETKFLPSYFPFVEPGLEVHIKLGNRWLEVMGAGMIHPGVIKNMGLNQNTFQGFAFGMGIDRLVAVANNIEDIRHFYSGNLRFLEQFGEEK